MGKKRTQYEDDVSDEELVDVEDEELEREIAALRSSQQPAERRPAKFDAPSLQRRLDQLSTTIEGSAHYLPFLETLCVVGTTKHNLKNIEDEFVRENALYVTVRSLAWLLSVPLYLLVTFHLTFSIRSAAQALEAVDIARPLIVATGTPFARPDDFFAEMVKDDVQMGKVRQRLSDMAGSMKRADDVAKLRKLKKFGKAVQVEKLQEKQKRKTEDLGKLDLIKKRTHYSDTGKGCRVDVYTRCCIHLLYIFCFPWPSCDCRTVAVACVLTIVVFLRQAWWSRGRRGRRFRCFGGGSNRRPCRVRLFSLFLMHPFAH